MTYQEFENEIMAILPSHLPADCSTILKPVQKNNGVILHGIIISSSETNISPTVYLDPFWDQYKSNISMEEIAKSIAKIYEENKTCEEFDVSVFTDFEKCKNSITYKLINYEKNKALLEEIPHVIYLDLAIVFYCLISANEGETRSILIRNEHIKLWNVKSNDLFELASCNTPKLLNSHLSDLSDTMRKIAKASNNEELYMQANYDNQIYVLTNKLNIYGACCILYKQLLQKISERLDSDLYIIPSSVHEVLLIPSTSDINPDGLSNMIQAVNDTELSKDEVLSDHLYYYSRQENCISY